MNTTLWEHTRTVGILLSTTKIHTCTYPFIHPSIYMHLVIHLSIYLYVHSSIYPSIISFHPFIHPSIYLYVHSSFHSSIHPFIYLCINLILTSNHPFIYQSIDICSGQILPSYRSIGPCVMHGIEDHVCTFYTGTYVSLSSSLCSSSSSSC